MSTVEPPCEDRPEWREADTWIVPSGLTSTDSGPVHPPQMGRDGGESDV